MEIWKSIVDPEITYLKDLFKIYGNWYEGKKEVYTNLRQTAEMIIQNGGNVCVELISCLESSLCTPIDFKLKLLDIIYNLYTRVGIEKISELKFDDNDDYSVHEMLRDIFTLNILVLRLVSYEKFFSFLLDCSKEMTTVEFTGILMSHNLQGFSTKRHLIDLLKLGNLFLSLDLHGFEILKQLGNDKFDIRELKYPLIPGKLVFAELIKD